MSRHNKAAVKNESWGWRVVVASNFVLLLSDFFNTLIVITVFSALKHSEISISA